MKKVICLFIFFVIMPLVLAGNVTRVLSSSEIDIGEEVNVTLFISLNTSTLSYFIQESIPLGANIINYSDGVLTGNNLRFAGDNSLGILKFNISYRINFSSVGNYVFASDISYNGYEGIFGNNNITVGEPIFDKDKDNIPDNIDKCDNVGMVALDKLNKFGCPKPKLEKFDIKPNFTDIDLFDISDLEIGVSNKAKIIFQYGKVNLMRNVSGNYSELDLDSYVNISKNRVEINSSALPELNKSAKIIMYNVSFSNPMILRDGVNCSNCKNLAWSASSKTFSFKAPYFSVYSLAEGPLVLPDEDDEGDGAGGESFSCYPIWNCSLWSNAEDSCGIRTCNDKNHCGTDFNKPPVTKTCSTYCGNGVCDSDETCDTCSFDCGVCIIDTSRANSGISCGDGICSEDEDNLTCSEDCTDNTFLFWLVVYIIIGLIILGLFFLIKIIRGNQDKKFPINNFNSNNHKNSHLYKSYDEYSRFS